MTVVEITTVHQITARKRFSDKLNLTLRSSSVVQTFRWSVRFVKCTKISAEILLASFTWQFRNRQNCPSIPLLSTCTSWSLFPGGCCSLLCMPLPMLPFPRPPPPPHQLRVVRAPAGAQGPPRGAPCSSQGESDVEAAGRPTTTPRRSFYTLAGWTSGGRSSPSLQLPLLPDRPDSQPDQQTFCCCRCRYTG